MSADSECYFGLCVHPKDRQPGHHWALVCLQPHIAASWILHELHPLYSSCWFLTQDEDEFNSSIQSLFQDQSWFRCYKSWNRCVDDLSHCSTSEFQSTVLVLGDRFTQPKYIHQLPINLARVHVYSDEHVPRSTQEWSSVKEWFVSSDIANHITMGRWIHSWMEVQAGGYLHWIYPFGLDGTSNEETWITQFSTGQTEPVGSIRCRPLTVTNFPISQPCHSHWMDRLILVWLIIMVHWSWISHSLRWLLNVESDDPDSWRIIA
jgi:hypothetical protein